ncbi:hypothetical protein LINGRAHAP2_LOCUS32762, partial [Linum grandiflorum]
VADLCSFHDSRSWSIPLRFVLRGGAREEWNRLVAHLASIPADFISAGPAYIVWPLETSGVFSVSSLRNVSSTQRFPGNSYFPHEVVWYHCVPSKIQCFIWMVFHKKIATIENLQRRGFHLAGRCVLCYNHGETIDHIFLHCAFTRDIWRRFSSVLSIHGPVTANVDGFITAWKGMNFISRFNVVMRVMMHATLWSVWLERNNRIFRDESRTTNQIFHKIMRLVGSWLHSWGLFSDMLLSDWHRVVLDTG